MEGSILNDDKSELMTQGNTKTGTSRWYAPKTSKTGNVMPGRFTAKKTTSEEINKIFDDGQELALVVDLKNKTVLIRYL